MGLGTLVKEMKLLLKERSGSSKIDPRSGIPGDPEIWLHAKIISIPSSGS